MKLFLVLLSLGFSWIASATEMSFIDSPEKCFADHKYPCSIRVSGGFLAFEKDGQSFHLGDGSSLLFVAPSQVQLLKGLVWVKESKELIWKVSPLLQFSVSGEWFFEKQPDTTLLARNLNGEIEFQSKKIFPSESLPLGFQNWFGPLDSSGQISRGMIRPVVWEDFLKVWLPLSGASVAEMKATALEYKDRWKGALEQASEIYRQVAERRIASQEEKQNQLAHKAQVLKDEQSRLREMYRERNGLGFSR